MFTIIGGDGKEYGPVTAEQVRVWLSAGRASLDTKAKGAGSDEWRRLGDYAEFSDSAPPPMVGAGGADRSALASRGARIGAALINAGFYVICMMPGSMMISRKLLEENPDLARGTIPRMDELDLTGAAEGILYTWVGLLAAFLLQTILLSVRGQNLGKMMVGARVVRADTGEPAGFVRAALLRFILPVGVMITLNALTAVLGFVLLLVDFCFIFRADGRCLHDLVAGTKVVGKTKS